MWHTKMTWCRILRSAAEADDYDCQVGLGSPVAADGAYQVDLVLHTAGMLKNDLVLHTAGVLPGLVPRRGR
jgi:hypothetical protein